VEKVISARVSFYVGKVVVEFGQDKQDIKIKVIWYSPIMRRDVTDEAHSEPQ